MQFGIKNSQDIYQIFSIVVSSIAIFTSIATILLTCTFRKLRHNMFSLVIRLMCIGGATVELIKLLYYAELGLENNFGACVALAIIANGLSLWQELCMFVYIVKLFIYVVYQPKRQYVFFY